MHLNTAVNPLNYCFQVTTELKIAIFGIHFFDQSKITATKDLCSAILTKPLLFMIGKLLLRARSQSVVMSAYFYASLSIQFG